KIKLEFGLAKGKKKFDKRESIKKREVERKIKSEIKHEGVNSL
ncbi:MAG TPA: SsrA-binding protein, partial [Candidatus Pacearchaeota archaeon]|nr:SsrA-binding protein [Candidatus Pacearchaeota archaeon]